MFVTYYKQGDMIEAHNLSKTEVKNRLNKAWLNKNTIAIQVFSQTEFNGLLSVNHLFNPFVVLDNLSKTELITYCVLYFKLFNPFDLEGDGLGTFNALEKILYNRCGKFYAHIEGTDGTIDMVKDLDYIDAIRILERYEGTYHTNRVSVYCSREVVAEWRREA